MKQKMHVVLGLPRGWEWFGLFALFMSLFGLFQASNLYILAGESWFTHFSGSITFKGSIAFWVLSSIFLISTMFLVSRSLLVKGRNTFNTYDVMVGFLMVLGVFLVVIGTLYGVFKGQPNIEFLYNLKNVGVLRTGWILMTLGGIWYSITK